MCISLLEKYRPQSLADVRGQSAVVRSLKLFARSPYPVAFLFHGPSGVGKTCAARALARDLGCQPDERELGGVCEIASGEMTADRVREAVRRLNYRPMLSASGWRMLLCNEADRMSPAAETVWLDVLEHLPPSAVVVFTTNAPESLTQRFRDRCEVYAFEGETKKLRPHIRALARDVWAEEIGPGDPPHLDILGMPQLLGPDAMFASFRLALQQLVAYVREAQAGGGDQGRQRVRAQLERSLTATSDEEAHVDCDHCGQDQVCRVGQRRKKCEACGKQFSVSW